MSSSGYSNVFIVYSGSDFGLNPSFVDTSNYIRPVINLRADVKLTGSGTSTDPYIVS